MRAFIIVALTLFTQLASAQRMDAFTAGIKRTLPRLESIGGATAFDIDAPETCKRTFAPIQQKNLHRIVLGFGYSDTTPKDTVYDFLARNALKRQLLTPCNAKTNTLCGFRQIADTQELFRRRLPTVDGRGLRTVEIRLIGASLSESNARNTNGLLRSTQTLSCQNAEAEFFNEVKNGADTVIYFGHARNGGGPDFCPAVVTADGQHVNYSHYRSVRRGITNLTKAIREARTAGKRSSLIALMACGTQIHFKRRLLAAAPDQGLILTARTITFDHVWHDTLSVLSASLQQSCKAPLEELLLEGFSHGIQGASVLTNYL